MRISDWSSDVFSSDLAIRYAITVRIQRATLGINLHALGGSRAQIGVVRHTVAIRILGSFGCAGGLRTQCSDPANRDDGSHGRASCRGRVWQQGMNSVVVVYSIQ